MSRKDMEMFARTRLFASLAATVIAASCAFAGGPVKPTRTPRYVFVPLPGIETSLSGISPDGRYLIGSSSSTSGYESLLWKDGRLNRRFGGSVYLTAVNNRGAVAGSLNRLPFVEYNSEKGGAVSQYEGELRAITSNGVAYGYTTYDMTSSAFAFDPRQGGSYPFGIIPGVHTNFLAANDRGTTVVSRTENYATHVYANGSFGSYEIGFGYGTVRVSTLTGSNAVIGAAYDGVRMNAFIQYPGAPIQTLRSLEIDAHSWATPRSMSGNIIVGVDDNDPDQMPWDGYNPTAIIWLNPSSAPTQLDALVINGWGLHLTDAVGIGANGVIAVNAETKDGRHIGGRLIPFYPRFR